MEDKRFTLMNLPKCKLGHKKSKLCEICLSAIKNQRWHTNHKSTKQTKLCDIVNNEIIEDWNCPICNVKYHYQCIKMFSFSSNIRVDDCCLKCKLDTKVNDKACIVCNTNYGIRVIVPHTQENYVAHIVCMYFSTDFLVYFQNGQMCFIPYRNLNRRKNELRLSLPICFLCEHVIHSYDSYFVCCNTDDGFCDRKAHVFCALYEFACALDTIHVEHNPKDLNTTIPLLYHSISKQLSIDKKDININSNWLLDIISNNPAVKKTDVKDIKNMLKDILGEYEYTMKRFEYKMSCNNHDNRSSSDMLSEENKPYFIYCKGCAQIDTLDDQASLTAKINIDQLKSSYFEILKQYEDLPDDVYYVQDNILYYDYYCKYCIDFVRSLSEKGEFISKSPNFNNCLKLFHFARRCYDQDSFDGNDEIYSTLINNISVKDEYTMLESLTLQCIEGYSIYKNREETATRLAIFLRRTKGWCPLRIMEHIKGLNDSIVVYRNAIGKHERFDTLEKCYKELENVINDLFEHPKEENVNRFISFILKYRFHIIDNIFRYDIIKKICNPIYLYYIEPLKRFNEEIANATAARAKQIKIITTKKAKAFKLDYKDVEAFLKIKIKLKKIQRVAKRVSPNSYVEAWIMNYFRNGIAVDFNSILTYGSLSYEKLCDIFYAVLHLPYFDSSNGDAVLNFIKYAIEMFDYIKTADLVLLKLKSINPSIPKTEYNYLVVIDNLVTVEKVDKLRNISTKNELLRKYIENITEYINDEYISNITHKITSINHSVLGKSNNNKQLLDILTICVQKNLVVTKYIKGNLKYIYNVLYGKIPENLLKVHNACNTDSNVAGNCQTYDKLACRDTVTCFYYNIKSELAKFTSKPVYYTCGSFNKFAQIYHDCTVAGLHIPSLNILKENFEYICNIKTSRNISFTDLLFLDFVDIEDVYFEIGNTSNIILLERLLTTQLNIIYIKDIYLIKRAAMHRYIKLLEEYSDEVKPDLDIFMRQKRNLSSSLECTLIENKHRAASKVIFNKISALVESCLKVSKDFNPKTLLSKLKQDLNGLKEYRINATALYNALNFFFNVRILLQFKIFIDELCDVISSGSRSISDRKREKAKGIVEIVERCKIQDPSISVHSKYTDLCAFIKNNKKLPVFERKLNNESKKPRLKDYSKNNENISKDQNASYSRKYKDISNKPLNDDISSPIDNIKGFVTELGFDYLKDIKEIKSTIDDLYDEALSIAPLKKVLRTAKNELLLVAALKDFIGDVFTSEKDFNDKISTLTSELQRWNDKKRHDCIIDELNYITTETRSIKILLNELQSQILSLPEFSEKLNKIHKYIKTTCQPFYFNYSSIEEFASEIEEIKNIINSTELTDITKSNYTDFKINMPAEIVRKLKLLDPSLTELQDELKVLQKNSLFSEKDLLISYMLTINKEKNLILGTKINLACSEFWKYVTKITVQRKAYREEINKLIKLISQCNKILDMVYVMKININDLNELKYYELPSIPDSLTQFEHIYSFERTVYIFFVWVYNILYAIIKMKTENVKPKFYEIATYGDSFIKPLFANYTMIHECLQIVNDVDIYRNIIMLFFISTVKDFDSSLLSIEMLNKVNRSSEINTVMSPVVFMCDLEQLLLTSNFSTSNIKNFGCLSKWIIKSLYSANSTIKNLLNKKTEPKVRTYIADCRNPIQNKEVNVEKATLPTAYQKICSAIKKMEAEKKNKKLKNRQLTSESDDSLYDGLIKRKKMTYDSKNDRKTKLRSYESKTTDLIPSNVFKQQDTYGSDKLNKKIKIESQATISQLLPDNKSVSLTHSDKDSHLLKSASRLQFFMQNDDEPQGKVVESNARFSCDIKNRLILIHNNIYFLYHIDIDIEFERTQSAQFLRINDIAVFNSCLINIQTMVFFEADCPILQRDTHDFSMNSDVTAGIIRSNSNIWQNQEFFYRLNQLPVNAVYFENLNRLNEDIKLVIGRFAQFNKTIQEILIPSDCYHSYGENDELFCFILYTKLRLDLKQPQQ